ncbi:RHS repeat-associated protein [Tahibacter aquaticus]|uniref:RHS repeat-associated protein n=1 Tax=Tahibacter aquaticus TaxID=520092 RepID=A0A4R6YN32_9GAMM|nr:RHS repeat-associated core domain-containing protein [Tahibacter aquaticus]TDR38772.1 RHS repeat-associated protein [Tahibacter aquaticus]
MTLQRNASPRSFRLATAAWTFAATALLALAAAQAGDRPAAALSPREAVADALLRGIDARAALAEALARDADSPATRQQQYQATRQRLENSAIAGFSRQAQQLRASLASAATPTRKAFDPARRNALLQQVDALQAQGLLLQGSLEKSDKLPNGKSATPSPFARERRQALAAWLNQIGAASDSLRTTLQSLPEGRAPGIAVFAELDQLLAADAQAEQAPVYGAAVLPVHRPRLPAREPATAPAVIPSYADAEHDIEPQPADYAATPDAPLSPAVLAKARSLDNDYTRIVDFVRSSVKTRWYAGAQQDADTTLRTLSGNDVDQASLLIALLRASQAPARYVRGVLEVDTAQLVQSLGVREDKVGLALAAAGVAHKPVIRGGRVAAYAIEHVYVSAYLPFSNYRGSAADLAGKAWIPLAPALKPHRLTPAGGALARSGIDAAAFIDEHLAQLRDDSPLDRLRSQIDSRLAALATPLSYESQLAVHAVAAAPLQLLPASLPAASVAVTGEFAALPDDLRQQVRLLARSGSDESGAVILDVQLPASQLAGRRITLSYQPASIGDGAVVDAHGGMSATPPYLFQVRPVLQIDGLAARIGSGILDAAAAHRLDITLSGPAGSTGASQLLTAGGYAAIALDTQADAELPQPDAPLPGDNEQRAARVLANLGARYLSNWNRDDDELARLLGVGLVRPFPSAVLVINQYRIERSGGLAQAMQWRGVALDAALRPAEAFAHVDAAGAESDWTALSALQGSSLEHRVFEQQWHVDSLSADKGLALARAQNIPILTLNAASGSGGVNQPPAVIAAVNAWLARGYVVDIAKNPLTLQAWTGAVWRVRNLPTGEAGYFIAGNLAGGSTAMPPELWYLQDLVQWLGDPYALPLNEDPMAGAILTLDADSQYQMTPAGQALPRPLRAIVLDAGGRPVKGAAVTFAPLTPNGHFPGVADGESALVLTDARGVASIGFVTGAKILDGAADYIHRPNQPEPELVGRHWIHVSAQSAMGPIVAGNSFFADATAGAATRLELTTPNTELSTGVLFGRLYLDAFDANSNLVSNVPLNISIESDYTVAPQCPLSSQRIDGALFIHGDCPTNQSILTGHACTRQQIGSLHSRPDGITLGVTPGNANTTARYTVRATSPGLSKQIVFSNEAPVCNAGPGSIFWHFVWYDGHRLSPDSDYEFIVAAAPLNQLFPRSFGIESYRYAINVQTNTIQWTRDGTYPLVVKDALFGTVENLRYNSGAVGITRFEIRAGSEPGPVEIWLGSPDSVTPKYIHFGSAISLHAPVVTPNPLPLTPFSTTAAPTNLKASFDRNDYTAGTSQLQIRVDGEPIAACYYARLNTGTSCSFDHGLQIDRTRSYEAAIVINEGTPYRLEATRPLPFEQGIVAGYGVLPPAVAAPLNAPAATAAKQAKDSPLDLVGLLQSRFPKNIAMNQDVEVSAGYACLQGRRFGYLLSQDATVSLAFFRRDGQGNTSPIAAWKPLDGVALPAGLHDLQIDPRELALGEYKFELRAVNSAGEEELHEGTASNHVQRRDSLTLSHPFVKGVDLYSGGAVIGEEDIAIGGRGPGIKLERTYSSHGGEQIGFLGRGWNTALDGQVLRTDCDERIVVGIGGQGQRFRPSGVLPDGSQTFTALHGYHGTLLQRGDTYDFHGRDGLHYHYSQADLGGPRISYVQDSNGNRVSYRWEMNQGTPRVSSITDASGREVSLVYEVVRNQRQSYGIDIEEVYTLLKEIRGPLGLRIAYDYDSKANLSRVTRTDASTKGRRVSGYTYQDFGGIFHAAPDGSPSYFHFGHRLKTARDEVGGGIRRYEYQLGWSGVRVGDNALDVLYLPEQRVRQVTEADNSVTAFNYSGLRGLGAVTTDITDPRQKSIHYAMNPQGGAELVRDEAGETRTVWNLVHRQPATITDALNTVSEFGYDDYGNKTSETVTRNGQTLTRNWTWYAPGDFFAPYLTDRVKTATDARRIVTSYTYDPNGNPATTERGGITTIDVFGGGGDHIRHTDGDSNLWEFRYDAYGYPQVASTPLRKISRTEFDALGRKRSETDPNGHKTSWEYDARNRVVLTTYPGDDKETRLYEDTLRRLTITNPRNIPTVQNFDAMGRLLTESVADGMRELSYDDNGNILSQTDFAGHKTSFAYDAVNRLERKHEWADESLQRTTIYAYDALGHVTAETVGEGPDASVDTRRREYRYEHPTYARTHVRAELVTEQGSRWLEEITAYDANGNPLSTTDALLRTTTREFDNLDRLKVETAPLGRVTRYDYDNRGNKRFETRLNPGGSGTQVREWRYDNDGRQTDSIDAEGKLRRVEYDNARNITARIDARGYRTSYRYDDRNNLVEESGPEAGQLTSYDYDANNNRIGETWSNGRVLSRSYDARDRLWVSSDQQGVIETRSYWPDGLLRSVTDAEGRLTRQFHDGLHRLYREELPGTSPRPRRFGHSIHGEVVSETDPLDHTTIHAYDSLGRKTSSTAPTVENITATATTRYDDVGNVLEQTDALNQSTQFFYNALNQRIAQTDPQACAEAHSGQPAGSDCHQHWLYDALGNVLSHTDRRGIVSIGAYDRENRLKGQSRDGLIVQTLDYDDQGNLAKQWDAENRLTTFDYDQANRKTAAQRAGLAEESWTYTPLNDVDTHVDADGYPTTYRYTLRRLLDSETRAGETTSYTYDDSGKLTGRQRPLGEAWTWAFDYDAAGRLATVTDPLQHSTVFGYDDADNRTRITDANDHYTQFHYDERNRLSGKTYPGGANWQWRYDANSNRTRSESPIGRVSTTTYDGLNRAELTTFVAAPAGEVQSTQLHYDGNNNVVRIEETSSSGTRSETRSYDAFDRADGVTDSNGRSLAYRYDDVGNRTERTDPDRQTTVWTYNDLNQNIRVFTPGLGTTQQEHTPAGRLRLITRPDGSLTRQTYNDSGRLETIVHEKAGSTVASYRYTYDLNGNRKQQHETNGAASSNATQLTTYSYDNADRLEAVAEPGRTTTYTLDTVGNRTNERVVNAGNIAISDSTLVYNDRDQLTSRNDTLANVNLVQTWDDNGNLKTQTVNGGTPRVYTYDARDRMIGLNAGPGTALSFAYHPDGLRREKTSTSGTTRYHYDDQSLLAETNAIGNTVRQYHYSAEQLIAETKAGTTPVHRQYLLDALRSPIALLTQQGAVSARTSYDAFGEIRAQVGVGGALVTPQRDQANAELVSGDEQSFGFTGYVKDTESGLYYAKARYYDPATGRFNTEDPEAGKDMEPPSLHRYLYAYANPTAYVDPTGRCANNICLLNYVYAYSKTPEQRTAATRTILNTEPTVGRIYGAAQPVYQTIENFAEINYDLISNEPEAVARMSSRMDALQAANREWVPAFTGGPVGILKKFAIDIGTSIGEHATQMREAIANNDYVGQGQAGTGLAADASQVIGAVAAVRSGVVQGLRFADLPKGLPKPTFPHEGQKPLANFFGNPKAGHPEALEILPGGSGRAVAGHGELNYPIRPGTVPEKSALTIARPGVALRDDAAQMMEAGDWDGLRELAQADKMIEAQVSGMRTLLPGSEVPDYVLMHPGQHTRRREVLAPLTIMENSITVKEPTHLSEILKPGQGCVIWAACTRIND